MKLVIAEKPVLAKNILEALTLNGASSKRVNALTYECGSFIITSLRGHILEYKEPKQINPKWASWNAEDLPIYSPEWSKQVKKEALDVFNNVKALLNRTDVDTVINAGDVDAEGQLLVDEVLEFLHNKKKVLRLNTANTTPEALLKALSSMKDNREYQGLKKSAEARTMADMIHSFTASRALSLQTDTKINVGRVASFIVYSVANRDNEIENFVPKNYFTIYAKANNDNKNCTVKLILSENDKLLDDNGYLSSKENTDKLVALINNNSFNGKVEVKKVNVAPPLPFDLLTLQKECGKYNLKSDKVLSITQSLRDNYGAITYNRTEHRELPIEYFNSREKDVPIVLKNLALTNYNMQKDYKAKCFVEDEKLKEHFGIIPQAKSVDISKMTKDERLVYTLIAKRYLMQFLGEDEKTLKTLTIDCGNNRTLKATQSEITIPRFSLLLDKNIKQDDDDKEKNEETTIPFDKGEYTFLITDTELKMSKTKPPQKFTSSSLLSVLKKNSLGTPATRDNIILNQYKAGYIKDDGKYIISTPLGQEYIKNVPSSFMSPTLTEEWKTLQDGIEKGKAEPIDLINSVLKNLEEVVKNAKESEKSKTFFMTDKSFGKREGDKIKTLYRGKGSMFSTLDKTSAFKLIQNEKLANAKLFSPKKNKPFIADVKITGWIESEDKKFLTPKIELSFEDKRLSK